MKTAATVLAWLALAGCAPSSPMNGYAFDAAMKSHFPPGSSYAALRYELLANGFRGGDTDADPHGATSFKFDTLSGLGLCGEIIQGTHDTAGRITWIEGMQGCFRAFAP